MRGVMRWSRRDRDAIESLVRFGGNKHGEADKVYRTCLCTLMLEVYYRFLSTGGGGSRENRGI
jgi:hypothetical protein